METPEDLQFYENNKTEIEKALKAKAEETKPAVVMPEENVAPEVVEPSKGAAVIMPDENIAAETTVVGPQQQGKAPSVIMPEANVAPEVAETVVTEEVAPVEKAKPEVKSKLEAFKTKFAPQPKEVSVSGVNAAQKRVNRQEAAKIAPTDARGFALSWMNQSPDVIDWDSIKDLFGGRRARLNVKEVTPEEIAKRDYVAEKDVKGEGIKTLNEAVNDIWKNLPEGFEDITTDVIKDELEALISEYPTRADAAKALIEYQKGTKGGQTLEEQQLAFEERRGIEEEGGEEIASTQFEGGFVPFEEDMDIEGMEEPPFAVEEPTTEEVAQMQDIVKDYIDDGTTSLSEIKKAIAKELGYNTKKLRQTIDDAYNKYTATKEAAPAEVTSGVIGRIGNALKKMFGKDAQKPFVAKDSKALEAKLKDIREDVKYQIEAGFRGTNDMPVAYRYDTDQVARERFDIPKLKQIGAGSDRVVFDLGDGKVLKVAKTPRGLEQNIYEGDYYLSGSIIPESFERGLNYVVVEKIDPPLKATKGFDKLNNLLNRIQKFSQKDFDQHNPELQEVIEEYEMSDIFNYDLLWNDFKAKRNWGLKDGQPLHLDGGSFGGIRMLDKFKGQKPLSDPEFRDIYNRSKKAKIENKDVDKFTKFMAEPYADLGIGIEKQKIIDKAKQDGTFMKAPNGKKSNLNEEQWVSVRTKEFKNWFGDWENNPKDASKVVDKNGEPRIVYHGTNEKFDAFSKEKLGSKNWLAESAYAGFFFAGDKKTSEAYTGMNNMDFMGITMSPSKDIQIIIDKYEDRISAIKKDISNVVSNEVLRWQKENDDGMNKIIENLKKDDKLKDIPGGIDNLIESVRNSRIVPDMVYKKAREINVENGNEEKLDKVANARYKEIEEIWKKKNDKEPKVLSLFLNIKNPYEFDYKDIEEDGGLNSHIEEAKLKGNDGVLFKNIKDGADVDDIFVAFEPSQIKSAEKNTGAYAVNDERINFMSDSGILGFTYKNKMYLNGEKLNPNTPIHEAGHIWVEWTKTNDPKIYAKGVELVEGSPYLKKVKDSKFYQQQAGNMTDAEKTDYFKNEALAMAIGDKGAQFVVESKKESFKDWLKTLWTKIKSLTGFKDLTEEEFQNLTFEEFSKMAVKEILGVENDLDQFQAARSMKKKKEFVKGKVRGEANKRAIDDFEVDDMIKLIKADYDLQTLKNIKDAIQKRSAEEVLPSQPRKIGERRGERKRVEPRVEANARLTRVPKRKAII